MIVRQEEDTFETIGEFRAPLFGEYWIRSRIGTKVYQCDVTNEQEEFIIVKPLVTFDIVGITESQLRYLRCYSGRKMSPILDKVVRRGTAK